MKVVCDNCQAVYKIADHKLVKEINRATCKRCGHKIIIFQHNPASARSTLKESVPPLGDSGAASASSEDIERLAQMTNGGLPSLGSLTKELRAISAPPLPPKAASASIGPGAAPITDPGPAVPPAGASTLPVGARIPGLNPASFEFQSKTPEKGGPLGEPAPPPRNGSSGAAIAPIPASDSPDTRVYRGPAPSGSVLSAAAAQSAAGAAAVAPVSETESTRPMPYSQPPLPVPPGGPSPGGPGGYSSPVISANVSNTSVTQIEHQGSPLLGTAGVLGAASFMGLLLVILVPGPLAIMGFALAGFGAAGTMALALITEKGRWPSKVPLAMLVGAVMGIGSGALALGIQSLDSAATTPVQAVTQLPPAAAPSLAQQPVETPAAGEDAAAADAAGEDETAAEPSAAAPAPAVKSPAPTRRRSSRASTRSSGPPQLPGLSAAERAELQSYASQKGSIGSSSPTRSSRSERASGGSRERSSSRASDKIAKSGSDSSYSGSTAPSRREKPVSAVTPTGPRGTPQSTRGGSGTKSSSSAPNQFIIKTIIGSNKSIKRCISSHRSRDPDLSGKLYVKFKISPSGSVSRARVTTSRYAGTALDTCISREVNALQFPPFEGKVQNITYPLLVIGD